MTINIILDADDVVLISNTRKEMQTMLKITENFGNKIELKFNPTKTNFMTINESLKSISKKYKNDAGITLKLDNKTIERVEKVKYLGMVISSNLKNTNHLLNRIALSYAAIGKLNKETMFDNRNLNPYVKFHQYKTYIRPLLTHAMC